MSQATFTKYVSFNASQATMTITALGADGASGPTRIRIHSITGNYRMPASAPNAGLPMSVFFGITDRGGSGPVWELCYPSPPINGTVSRWGGHHIAFSGGILFEALAQGGQGAGGEVPLDGVIHVDMITDQESQTVQANEVHLTVNYSLE